MDGWVDGWGRRESEFVFEGDENNNQHLSMNIQVDGKQDESLLESSEQADSGVSLIFPVRLSQVQFSHLPNRVNDCPKPDRVVASIKRVLEKCLRHPKC